jgi:hypothetical protein
VPLRDQLSGSPFGRRQLGRGSRTTTDPAELRFRVGRPCRGADPAESLERMFDRLPGCALQAHPALRGAEHELRPGQLERHAGRVMLADGALRVAQRGRDVTSGGGHDRLRPVRGAADRGTPDALAHLIETVGEA